GGGVGKGAGSVPRASSCSDREWLAAPNGWGVVLYADASQPSPRRATRRRPAAEPQLPIQTGTPPGRLGAGANGRAGKAKWGRVCGGGSSRSSGRRIAAASSKRSPRSPNGPPAPGESPSDEPGPTPAITRPSDRTSNAASAFASGTGPRSAALATVVASSMAPDRSMTEAKAVVQSSHGV